MKSVGLRFVSALVLTAILGVLFWLVPSMHPEMFGASTPNRVMLFFTVLFVIFVGYLVIQGYPLSHSDIGSSSSHNTDNMISAIPGVAAIIGLFSHFVGFWPMSSLNVMLAAMALVVVIYDLWILGGAASRINRLTDEIKTER